MLNNYYSIFLVDSSLVLLKLLNRPAADDATIKDALDEIIDVYPGAISKYQLAALRPHLDRYGAVSSIDWEYRPMPGDNIYLNTTPCKRRS